ncbi:MAG: NapC/NirT family cytochrome c [Proteobacteria bacterium]|nr:NapC/NirT family cytochrome c [Pseudomonadota bacterium]
MQLRGYLSRRALAVAAAILAVLIVGAVWAFEPVTRNFLAQDGVCTYCHLKWEYDPTARLTWSRPHRSTPDGGQARCVDCHLPPGTVRAAAAYLHFASVTDLFGRFRDRAAERAGEWIPPRAATTYRVRERLFEFDSVTCRTCHIESELKPKRRRGQLAHERAREKKETCIECHYSLVHRTLEVRETEFRKPEAGKK